MRVFIVGYMGAGKTTVGKRLGRRTGMPHIDLDDAFEERFRYSIPSFFDRFGEEKFREFEHECLKWIIRENARAVISTGGGTPCHHGNMALMNASGISIYLKMHPASLAKRLRSARRLRPLVRDVHYDDMQAFVEEQLAVREEFYERADITVKGEDVDLDVLVEVLKNSPPAASSGWRRNA
jgi:shikimate kinase